MWYGFIDITAQSSPLDKWLVSLVVKARGGSMGKPARVCYILKVFPAVPSGLPPKPLPQTMWLAQAKAIAWGLMHAHECKGRVHACSWVGMLKDRETIQSFYFCLIKRLDRLYTGPQQLKIAMNSFIIRAFLIIHRVLLWCKEFQW